MTRQQAGRWLPTLLAIAAIAGIIAVRLATLGWQAPSADHARYVFSGLALLDGQGFVNESGSPFLFRSPAYPLTLAVAFGFGGWSWAHIAALSLAFVALIIAVLYADSVGGPVSAIVAALVLIAVPIPWTQVTSLGIDLPQTGLMMLAAVCLWGPTRTRWAAGALVMGLAILVKETAAPAAILLPLAWLPAWSQLPWRDWARLATLFLMIVAVVTAWWWIYVYQATGLIFPLNSFEAIVPGEDAPGGGISLASIAIAAAVIGVWALVGRLAWSDVRVRLLVALGLAALPAAAVTIAAGQPVRNLIPLVLATSTATGILAAAWSRRLSPLGRLSRGTIAGVVVSVLAIGVVSQTRLVTAGDDPYPSRAAAAMRPLLNGGDVVVSTFKYRSVLGVELFESAVDVKLLPVQASGGLSDPREVLWFGERDGTLFEIRRDRWAAVLGDPDVVLASFGWPHPLTPMVLLDYLSATTEPGSGFEPIMSSGDRRGVAVFAIDPESVVEHTAQLPLTAQSEALSRWLDAARAAEVPDPVATILEQRPIVEGSTRAIADLAGRLGDGACFRLLRLGDRRAYVIVGRTDDAVDCRDVGG